VENVEFSFLPLLLVLGLAFLVPILLSSPKRIFIPIVIGEIIAGVIVGKSGLGVVDENRLLEILSSLGFVYLMFLSGLEIDFSRVLKKSGKKQRSRFRRLLGNHLFLAVTHFVLALGIALGAAYRLRSLGLINDIWIVALILATTSLGVVVPVLKERELTSEPLGQLLLVSSLIADFGSIFLISVYVLLRSHGLTAEVLLLLVLLAAFAAVYRTAALFQRHLPAERFFDRLSSATSQIELRGSLVLALIFIVLAENLGTENILGAFLAGVIVSMLSGGEGSTLRQKLDAIGYGFFIPIFFIMVGVNFDLPTLLSSRSSLLLVAVLVAVAFGVKFLPSLIFKLEYSWRETLAAGTLLSSRLSLLIAAAAIGLRLGVLSEPLYAAVILVAVITCTFSPMIFNVLLPTYTQKRDRILVIGCKKSAELLVNRLKQHDLHTVALCVNGEGNKKKAADGMPGTAIVDALSDRIRKAGLDKARAVVAIEETDEDNLRLCRMARTMFGVENLIAWVQDPLKNREFRQIGARVVNPAYSSLLMIEGMLLNPDAFSMTADVDETVEVREIKLKESQVVGLSIDSLNFRGGVTVLMIQRKGDFLVPSNETVLRANDVITLAGHADDLARALEVIRKRG
jgi:Kef-type K+ transport system membrane component KefB/Trk K+ transport system NAD-binding subunit